MGVLAGGSKSSIFGEAAFCDPLDDEARIGAVEGLRDPVATISSEGGADADATRDGETEEAGKLGGGACWRCSLRWLTMRFANRSLGNSRM